MPMATSSVVAGNRLIKLLCTGWRSSACILGQNVTARQTNATLSSSQTIIANPTIALLISGLTGQTVLA